MKKIFTAIGILSLSAALALTASAKTYTIGDVDNNSRITASDARQVLRASASLETLDNIQKIVADIDKNERITASDARAILRISANLEKAPGTVEIGDEASTSAPAITELMTDNTTIANDTTTEISDEPATLAPTDEPVESTTIVPGETTEVFTEHTTIVSSEPVTAEPTTIVPGETTEVFTEHTTIVSSEPVTAEPTTIVPGEPVTESPTEPTTMDPNEPVTIGPVETTEPIEDGATVAYENFPKQIKAFFSGKFGFEGYSYGSTGKEEMKLKTDGTNYKAGLQMDMGSGMKTYTMLLRQEKSLFNQTKTKVYMIFEAEKKYFDLSDLTSLAGGEFNMDDITNGLNFSLNVGDTNDLKAVVTYITEEETTYTIYTVQGPNNTQTIIRLLGDEIVRMTNLDDVGNISSQMDITKFYSDITDADFSLDGYKKVTILNVSELMALLS